METIPDSDFLDSGSEVEHVLSNNDGAEAREDDSDDEKGRKNNKRSKDINVKALEIALVSECFASFRPGSKEALLKDRTVYRRVADVVYDYFIRAGLDIKHPGDGDWSEDDTEKMRQYDRSGTGCRGWEFVNVKGGDFVAKSDTITYSQSWGCMAQTLLWPVAMKCPKCEERHFPDMAALMVLYTHLGYAGYKEGLDMSHLCGMKGCVRLMHVTWESHEKNNRSNSPLGTHLWLYCVKLIDHPCLSTV